MQPILCRKRRDQERLLATLRKKSQLQQEVQENILKELQGLEPVEILPPHLYGHWDPDGILDSLAVELPASSTNEEFPDVALLSRTPPVLLSPISEGSSFAVSANQQLTSTDINWEEVCATKPDSPLRLTTRVEPGPTSASQLLEAISANRESGSESQDISLEVNFTLANYIESGRFLRAPKTPNSPPPPRITSRRRETFVTAVQPIPTPAKSFTSPITLILRPAPDVKKTNRSNSGKKRRLESSEEERDAKETLRVIRLTPGSVIEERIRIKAKPRTAEGKEQGQLVKAASRKRKVGKENARPNKVPKGSPTASTSRRHQNDSLGDEGGAEPVKPNGNTPRLFGKAEYWVPLEEPRDNTKQRAYAVRKLYLDEQKAARKSIRKEKSHRK